MGYLYSYPYLEVYLNLLSYYLTNKWSLHVRSKGLEIFTLIGEK